MLECRASGEYRYREKNIHSSVAALSFLYFFGLEREKGEKKKERKRGRKGEGGKNKKEQKREKEKRREGGKGRDGGEEKGRSIYYSITDY